MYSSNKKGSKLKIQSQFGLGYAHLDLGHHLNSENFECVSDIDESLYYDLLQQRRQLLKGVIFLIVQPSLNKYPVVRLQLEVLSHVVHDDRCLQSSPNPAQVLLECLFES